MLVADVADTVAGSAAFFKIAAKVDDDPLSVAVAFNVLAPLSVVVPATERLPVRFKAVIELMRPSSANLMLVASE